MPQTYYKTPQGAYLTIKNGKVTSPAGSALSKLQAGTLPFETASYSDIWKIAQTAPTPEVEPEIIPEEEEEGFTEGDIRTNPSTGQREMLDPGGEWIPVTPEEETWQVGEGARRLGEEEVTPTIPIPRDIQTQVSETQSQVADLQAQQAALTQYGLTDTDQLTKDASGNYVPIGEEGEEGNGDTYDTGNEDFNAFLKVAQDLLQRTLDSGQIVNPNVELSDELIQQFQDQVEIELSPYYKSQFQSVRDDLSTDLSYLSTQYKQAMEASQATFKQTLAAQRESEAERGTIFSGGRRTREQGLAEATQRSIEGLTTGLGYQAQKVGTQAERTVGSLNLGGITSPVYQPQGVSLLGEGQYTPLAGRQLWTPSTGITGTLEREQITAKQLRQAELEEAERKKRSLTFYS